MTDADDLAYFTGVLKRLDALSNRVTEDSVLPVMAKEAKLYVDALVGCLIPESEGASIVGRREPVRVAAVKDDLAVRKFRQRMTAKVAEIQAALMTWLRPRDSEADSVCITNALLDTALDRHVAVHGADGFELIETAYRRAVTRWRGRLQ